MRGRKGKISSPSGIISTAIYMGLVALVRISRNRTNKKTRRYFRSIEKMWTSAWARWEEMKSKFLWDFLPIQNAEPNMRGQLFKLVFTSTKRYGNREVKRVYSWLEGTVGPLNALLNYAGARLRELAMIYYPFPRPKVFQVREYQDGSKRILTKREVDLIGEDDAIETYWRYGYERRGKNPRVLLAHPTLPGLDFVDIIRAHLVELCRQCFIYDVPMTEAHRYIRLLIHRLRPFLDWIYTDGQEGRRHFNPDADKELRKIVLEIRSLYKKRSRTRKRVSKRHGDSSISLSREEIREKTIGLLIKIKDRDELEYLLKFLDYIDTSQVADDDVEKTIGEIRERVVARQRKTTNKVERAALQEMLAFIDSELGSQEDTKHFEQIRKKIIRQLRRTKDSAKREQILRLLDYLDINAGCVQDRDVEKLVEQILAISGREGNQWHRILLSDLHHPVSLKQVVFSGDKMLDSPSSIQVVAELPVAKRSGQIDLTVFIRREVEGRILWTPVMILEIKTKTSIDFSLFGKHIKRKRTESVTPVFYAWKRTMNDEEWDILTKSGPEQSALQQLRNYESELLAEYRQVASHDPIHPSSLWKGVIVLDTKQSVPETFSAFQHLLEDLTTGIIHQLVNKKDSFSAAPVSLSSGKDCPRVVLLVAPSKGPSDLLDEMTAPRNLPEEDPFIDREQDDRILTLYVSVPSPTSSGITAARLSQNWHLLHHIQECIKTSPDDIEEVVWLDLMGTYRTEDLVRRRFGLDTMLRERLISKKDHRKLATTLRSIRFFDISPEVNSLLEQGAEGLDTLIRRIETAFPKKKDVERIIIIDGWTDLQGMLPRRHHGLLRILEQRLLNALPESKVNIIWIDEGTSHTRMNVHYQRRCVSPLRHDSPRRMYLDEIIYNLPTTPSGFGWTTPQREDVRVIVQDIPTSADPWKAAIHVPQLVGFAEKFRGLARRDRLVPPEVVEVYTSEVRSMHGKGVTLSSIYASTGRLSEDSFTSMIEESLTLVPSVQRSRGKKSPDKKVESEEEPLYQTVTQRVGSGSGSTLGGRTIPNVTRPPPTPRRGERSYIDVLTYSKRRITRPWHYDQTPGQFQENDEDESHVLTCPPSITDTGPGEIDTIETRERELRRLYYAARYLKDQKFLSQELIACCKRIEQYCAKQFALIKKNPSLRTPKFLLSALIRVKGILLKDSKRSDVWMALLSSREKIIDLLNTKNRQSMKEVMERTEDIFLLYGNNLFLAVLAALGDMDISLVEPLWNSVAEWTFYQLGMNMQESDSSRTVYNLQAILSNLKSRVKTLSQLSLPEKSVSKEETGAIIWRESENGYDALLLIPHENGFLTGVIEGLGDMWIPPKWYSCKTTPQNLKEFAVEALTSIDRTLLVVTTVLDSRVVWVPAMTEYDDEQQWISFSIIHGKPSGRWNMIPWMKLETTVPLAPPSITPATPDSVNETLGKLTRVRHRTIPVDVMVSVNRNLEVYEVRFDGGPRKKPLEFLRTRELVRFLRTLVSQEGYRIQGVTLTWDHKSDIYYGDDLSFLIPLVHRSRFYPDEYYYPMTCKELLAASTGEEVTMVVRQENKEYRVQFEGLPSDSLLRGLEEVGFDIFALGLLAECRGLYDPEQCVWYPITLNVDAVMDIRFSKIHEYPQLQEALQTADEEEFDWSIDRWQLFIGVRGEEVRWSIRSITTGRTWLNKTFIYPLTLGQPPDEELAAFRDVIARTVSFSHLSNCDDVLEGLRLTLVERYRQYLSTQSKVDADGEWHEEGEMEDDTRDESGVDAETTPLFEGVEFRYSEVEIRDLATGPVVVVFLESEEDETEIYVVRDVLSLENDSQFAGAIHAERVDTEVDENLIGYELKEDELERVKEAVKESLEERGVRFLEE
ncbi:MAG: hypothetical protein RTU30_05140 [Candidatus Thorarchaeota archaeon]